MRHKPFALTPRGVLGWVFGGVLGWVLSQHPPIDFSLSIAVSRDLGGCWGVFREKLYILHSSFYSKLFVSLPLLSAHLFALPTMVFVIITSLQALFLTLVLQGVY